VPNAGARRRLERTTNHDLAAFVDAVAVDLGPEGRWFHYGLTSSDVLDTALALTVRAAGGLVSDGMERAIRAGRRTRGEHRTTVTIGRTHGVHAEPTTFGLKLLGWSFQLDRDRARFDAALDGMRVGKLSGAVGDLCDDDTRARAHRLRGARARPAPSSTQILQRDRHAALLSALAGIASSLDRFATEVRHLARTEVRRSRSRSRRSEGFVGDAAQAQPDRLGADLWPRARRRGHALVGFENVALWHERDISHSSAERVVLPDAFLAVDYMLDRFAWLVEGLVIRPERMRANLEATGGLFFSQRLLLALVGSGLDRDTAYRLVQRHAMRAWDEGLDFRSLVRSDLENSAVSDPSEVLDLSAYTRHVDAVFERAVRLARVGAQGGADVSRTATHLASGKVREIHALDDATLVLVASDRISTFDVVLPTAIPDKGRVLTGLSAFWFARTPRGCPQPPARARRGRAVDDVPSTRDAARRVRRARLPRGLRLEGLPGDLGDLRTCPCGRAARVVAPSEAIVTPATKAASGTTRTSTRSRRPSFVAMRGTTLLRAAALELTLRPRITRRRAESCSPTRSSSSGVAPGGRRDAR
jgi:adenylosuccinate lyase